MFFASSIIRLTKKRFQGSSNWIIPITPAGEGIPHSIPVPMPGIFDISKSGARIFDISKNGRFMERAASFYFKMSYPLCRNTAWFLDSNPGNAGLRQRGKPRGGPPALRRGVGKKHEPGQSGEDRQWK